jgi:hypothetical protein
MYNSSDALGGGAAAGLFAFMGLIWLFALAVAAVVLIGMWKVFAKAGQPGWAALIPIYNIYVLLQIVGRPTWWLAFLLLSFIPGIGAIAVWVVMIILYNDLSKSFGQGVGFTVGLVLLSPIFMPILGFGSSQYLGPMATGFGNPETPGGYGTPGGAAPGGYPPPAQPYAPPAYQPPAQPYAPPAPPAPPAEQPAAPAYAPPAPPAYEPPAAPAYEPPAAPAAPAYEPPADPTAPPAPPAPPA